MVPRVFITGTTGYIGGDALYALAHVHPDWKYVALVRSVEKGKLVEEAAAKWKVNIELVYGALEDSKLLEEQSSKADIVLHTADASDHEGAARAIAKGLLEGHSKERPGYWLHTSGTAILCWYDMRIQQYGEAPSQPPYNDSNDSLNPDGTEIHNVSRLTGLPKQREYGLPDDALHRNVDKLVLEAGTVHAEVVKTAIVCPPTIYGLGRGPAKTRGGQVYNLTKATLNLKSAPLLGKGLTEWDNVHVHDLSNLFVLLAEAAVAGIDSSDLWGERGYFLAENGHHVWGSVSQEVANAAHTARYISSAAVKLMSLEDAEKTAGFDALSWGLNSKGKAERARKYLGWTPTGKSLSEEIPVIVESEAGLLGLSKSTSGNL